MKRIILPMVLLAFLPAFCADGVKLPPKEKFKIVDCEDCEHAEG